MWMKVTRAFWGVGAAAGLLNATSAPNASEAAVWVAAACFLVAMAVLA